jgi:DNA repair protein SbcC/Rad50
MANIQQITIIGFQSHVNSLINLGPGLNVITGPSDSGKTSIIRAVRWVAFNEPQGEAFVNESVGEAEVSLTMDTGVIITKRRRKGKTSYTVQMDPGDEGSTFEKSEVPDEVAAALGITKQTFGDFVTALNFAFQLEAPFLISETASAGAKILGKLAGTEAVDLAVKAVSKDTYAARQERTQADKEIERINGQLLEYVGLDEAKEMLEVCEMLVDQIDQATTKMDKMKECKHLFEVANDRIEAAAAKLDTLMIVPDLEKDLQDIEKAQQRYDTLLDLFNKLSGLDSRLAALEIEVRKYSDVAVAAASLDALTLEEGRLNALTTISKEYQKYTEVVNKNQEIVESLYGIESVDLNTLENDLERKENLENMKIQFDYLEKTLRRHLGILEGFRDLEVAESILTPLTVNLESLTGLKLLKAEYTAVKDNVNKCMNWVNKSEKDLEEAQQEYNEAWEATGGICPLCEQPHEGGRC